MDLLSCPADLVALVTAIAVIISKNISDDDELVLVAAVFTQLGDTLDTIAAQRELLSKRAPDAADEIILAEAR